jgi:hypothetical protein
MMPDQLPYTMTLLVLALTARPVEDFFNNVRFGFQVLDKLCAG